MMISLKLGTLLFSFGYVPITNHLYLQVGQSLRVWKDDLCRGGFDTLTGDEPFFLRLFGLLFLYPAILMGGRIFKKRTNVKA